MKAADFLEARNALILSLKALDERIRCTFKNVDRPGDGPDAMELFEERSQLECLVRDSGAVVWPFSMEDESWVK